VSPLSTFISSDALEQRELTVVPAGARLHPDTRRAQLHYRVPGARTPETLRRTCEILSGYGDIAEAFFSHGCFVLFVGPITLARKARLSAQKERLIIHFADVIRNVVSRVLSEQRNGQLALSAALRPRGVAEWQR